MRAEVEQRAHALHIRRNARADVCLRARAQHVKVARARADDCGLEAVAVKDHARVGRAPKVDRLPRVLVDEQQCQRSVRGVRIEVAVRGEEGGARARGADEVVVGEE